MRHLFILCLLMTGCATVKPMYNNGKHELGIAEKGEWIVIIRGRGVAIRKEF